MRKGCNLVIQLKTLITDLVLLSEIHDQQDPRLRKANQGRDPWQGPCCPDLMGNLKKEPSGKGEARTNEEATGYPLPLQAVGRGSPVPSWLPGPLK